MSEVLGPVFITVATAVLRLSRTADVTKAYRKATFSRNLYYKLDTDNARRPVTIFRHVHA